MDVKTSRPEILKVYRRRVRHWPVLPYEMVFEILVRLPVKSLIRFKSVSKAWRGTISDPCFIRSHLRQSVKNQEHEPSFLITPLTTGIALYADGQGQEVWPTNVSNHIPFYSWQEGQGEARLVHSTTFHCEFGSFYVMAHCDGLVLLSTDTEVYVFNPAIHDVLKLPDGQEDVWQTPTVGFGLDHRTHKYKVAHVFYRYLDFSMRTYNVGMEILTIGGDDIDSSWRSIAEDPPLPIRPWSVTHFKGSLYLFVSDELVEKHPQGALRFNLEDETFSFISHPKSFSPKEEALRFIELGGELCLAQGLVGKQVIWMLLRSAGEWVQHYVIVLPESEPWKFKALSVIPKDVLFFRGYNYLYHYDDARRDLREVVRLDRLRYKNPRVSSFDFVGRDDVFLFAMLSYTESLLPVTKPETTLCHLPKSTWSKDG
ncbi:hypothetical protein VPH35_048876 [Triticum aestivum]